MFGSLGLIFFFFYFFIFKYFSFIFRRKKAFYIPIERSRDGRHWVSRPTLQMLLIRGPEAKPPRLVRLWAAAVTPNWISLVKIRALRHSRRTWALLRNKSSPSSCWVTIWGDCFHLSAAIWTLLNEKGEIFRCAPKIHQKGSFSFPYFIFFCSLRAMKVIKFGGDD